MPKYTDYDEALHILTLMLEYDYGYPAFEEKWALKYAIQAIKDRRERNKEYLNS